MKANSRLRQKCEALAKRINPDEFLFDAASIPGYVLATNYLFPDGLPANPTDSIAFLVLVVILIHLFIPWYLGGIIAEYHRSYAILPPAGGYLTGNALYTPEPSARREGRGLMKLVPRSAVETLLFSLTILVMLSTIPVMLVYIPRWMDTLLADSVDRFLYRVGGFILMLAGWLEGYTGLRADPGGAHVLGISRRAFMTLCTFILLPAALLCLLFYSDATRPHAVVPVRLLAVRIGIIVSAAIGFLALVLLFVNLLRRLSRSPSFRNIGAPVLLAFLFVMLGLIGETLRSSARAVGSSILISPDSAPGLMDLMGPVIITSAVSIRLLMFLLLPCVR